MPGDPLPPTKTSGIRIGTPAVTTRGMTETEMAQIADWMTTVIRNPQNEHEQARILGEVKELTQHFPMPGEQPDMDLSRVKGE